MANFADYIGPSSVTSRENSVSENALLEDTSSLSTFLGMGKTPEPLSGNFLDLIGHDDSRIYGEEDVDIEDDDSIDAYLKSLPTTGFPTTMNLTYQQRRAERAAKTELRNSERLFKRMGVGDEWEDFLEDKGKTGLLDAVDIHMENPVGAAFDILQVGQYTTVAIVREILKSGDPLAAFKQAAVEFGNAAPMIDIEGAEEPGWADVFTDLGASRWQAASAGLLFDIVLDPMNLIPGYMFVSGISKTSKFAKKALDKSGPIGEKLRMMFQTDREIKALGDRASEFGGLTEQGTAFLELANKSRAMGEGATVKILDRVDSMIAWMTPAEKRLFGMYMDTPNLLRKEIDEFVEAGWIAPERVSELHKMIDKIQDHVVGLNRKEIRNGLPKGRVVDDLMDVDYYLHWTENLATGERRAWEKLLKERKPLLGHASQTQGQRIQKALDIEEATGRSVLDIGHLLARRSVDHVRQMNHKKFLDTIVNDGRISSRVEMREAGYFSTKDWFDLRKTLIEDGKRTGRKVYEVTSKHFDAGSGKISDEVVGAYILPDVIVDYLQKTQGIGGKSDDLGQFWDAVDGLTNIWRGYATLSPGFHSRNYFSMLINNWLADVGQNYKAAFKEGNLKFPGQEFVLRHLQALRIQVMADGAGRMPRAMKKAADTMAEKYGFGNFESIPMPTVKHPDTDEILPIEDLIRMGEELGVPQNATKLSNLPQDHLPKVWGHLEDSVPIKGALPGKQPTDVQQAAIDRMDSLTRRAMKPPEQGTSRRVLDKLKLIFGEDAPWLQLNRSVAHIVENNGRWALFLDRVIKKEPAQRAYEATKKWHFDYRDLTDIEKRVFRSMMPFYAWTRFAAPRMFMAMIENPTKMSKIPKIQNSLEHLTEQWSNLPTPDYYDEVHAMQMPFLNRDKPLFMQLDIPVLELNRLNKKDVLSSLHPLIKLPFESAPHGGYSFFLDSPIERFPGEESELGIERRTEATLGGLFPPLSRWGFRPAKAAKKGELTEWAVNEVLGVKLRNLDVRRTQRAKTFANRKLAREFKRILRQRAEKGNKTGLFESIFGKSEANLDDDLLERSRRR